MTIDDFCNSLSASQPPPGFNAALAGLWWDAKGDWQQAHESAQREEGPEACVVHAYLHRKEGDDANAAYWYGRAGRPVCRKPLEEEWRRLVEALAGDTIGRRHGSGQLSSS